MKCFELLGERIAIISLKIIDSGNIWKAGLAFISCSTANHSLSSKGREGRLGPTAIVLNYSENNILPGLFWVQIIHYFIGL